MKTVAKRILTLIVVFCMACVGLVCTPITGAKAADVSGSYVKVTSTPSDWSGDYLIVYEAGKVAFNGGLASLDAVKNTIAVAISNNEIEANATTNAAKFTIAKSGSNYTIKSASGYYVGQTSNANGLKSNKTTTYSHTISLNSDGSVHMISGGAYLRYNAASDQCRFRYYKSGTYTEQKAIFLYKFVETIVEEKPDLNEDVEASLNAVNAYMTLAYSYEESMGIVDTLTRETTKRASGAGYDNWSGQTVVSDAVYAGNSAGGNDSIQLRTTNDNSGIVTTASGGVAKRITVKWNSSTTAGRTLNIYGKNTAYSAATDLYNPDKDGDLLGTIVYDGTSTELDLTVKGDYEYIGIRSSASALYLDSIEITWAGGDDSYLHDSDFKIKCAVDASLTEIADVYGIHVSAKKSNQKDYASTSLKVEGDKVYIVINLGDIINDDKKLGTEFTVQAYIKVGDATYLSESVKTYSVAGMIKTYYETENIQDVEHLYNHLVDLKLI